METVTDWKALLFALGSALGAGLYLKSMVLRVSDRAVADSDSDGRLFLDFAVLAALVLFTIWQLKNSCAELI